MMKKIFVGVSYLLLLVISFAYMMITWIYQPGSSSSAESLLTSASYTGLSIIGYLFLIPAFVFTIIDLCTQKLIVSFIRDMVTLFSSVFILASLLLTLLTRQAESYYVPVILTICGVILFVLSLMGVIHGIQKDSLKKTEAPVAEPVPAAPKAEAPKRENAETMNPVMPEEPVIPSPIEVKHDDIDNL